MKPGKTGLTRVFDATRYSYQGFKSAYKNEAAFRQELAITVIGLPCAFWLSRDSIEFLLLALPLLLMLLVELANSAIESIIDRFGGEYNELSGQAKDMGSAMVFMAISIVVTSWTAILGGEYIW